MGGLSDLDFGPGLEFEKMVLERFNSLVSCASPTSAFVLVASFGRSSVKLNVDSVSIILQSCLGGSAKDFEVVFLSGWMFSFKVSCKNVGLLIYRPKSFVCNCFAVYFSLWGNGGANWIREFELWSLEKEAEWTLIGANGKAIHPSKFSHSPLPKSGSSSVKKSYADMVRSKAVKTSVFKRLSYPCDYQNNFIPNPSQRRSNSLPAPEKMIGSSNRWIPKTSVSTFPASAFNKVNYMNIKGSNVAHLSEGSNSNFKKSGLSPPRTCFVCNGPGQFQKAHLRSICCLKCLSSEYFILKRFWKDGPLLDSGVISGPNLRQSGQAQSLPNSQAIHLEGEGVGVGTAFIRQPEYPRKPLANTNTPPLSPPPSATSSEVGAMANFAVDPRPFVPEGWEVELPPAQPHLHHEVFVAGCYSHCNENLAIIKL